MTTPTNSTSPDGRASPHSHPSPPIPAEPRPLVYVFVLATQVPDPIPTCSTPSVFSAISLVPSLVVPVMRLPIPSPWRRPPLAYRPKLELQRWSQARHRCHLRRGWSSHPFLVLDSPQNDTPGFTGAQYPWVYEDPTRHLCTCLAET